MTVEEMKARIEAMAPGTEAQVTDMTGGQDHFQVLVVSPAFEGKKLLEQQKMVQATLDKEIQSGEVHALTMRTYTPEQYEKTKG